MSRKIECLPRDGASSTTPSTSTRRLARGKVFFGCLWLSCAVCFILCLICFGLVALVAAMDIPEDKKRHSSDSQKLKTNLKISATEVACRLPSGVEPKHYDLLLHPVLDKSIFNGEVTILINVREKRNTILIHQKDIAIRDAKLTTHGLETDYEIEIEKFVFGNHDMFIIMLKQNINPGLYDLSMSFSGSLANKMVGFYSSKYRNKQNITSYIATTKFEPTYARQAFPCFDEPNFKATFKIKLRYKEVGGYKPLSNMNVEEMKKEANKDVLAIFETTKRMSTYLACFIISDFSGQYKTAFEGSKKHEFKVTVYTANIHAPVKSSLALETAVQAIEYYVELFGVDYPLPKLDLIAIPDFVSGAMENWGLVTFRETRLLHDPSNDSINHKHDVINVVCHELAHMWFGNLVTMSWWNDLWLNEGFATYMSYKSANDLQPTEGHMNNFVVEIMHPVLSYDSTTSTHPIIYDVKNPDEITSFFDDISYKKGACILRMIEHFVGHEVFYDAIRNYLNKYAYGNAETNDLLASLQEVVDKELNITDIVNLWTTQTGYPLITVHRKGNKYILTQQYYCTKNGDTETPSSKWTIPITYITNKNDTPTLVWLNKDNESVEITICDDTKWIKVNVDQVGYYRVNYTDWYPLINLLSYHHTRLSIADRVNLLDDIFTLAEDGHCLYETAFNFMMCLSEEYSAAPWETAYSKLQAIYNMLYLRSVDDANNFLKYLRRRYRFAIYKEVGWTVDETDSGSFSITRRARVAILKFACFLEIDICLKEASELFDAWLYRSMDVHPDIRSLVYYYGLRSMGKSRDMKLSRAWHYFVDKFINETDPNEKNRMMYGLSGVQSEEFLLEFIRLAKDKELVRPQDFLNCLIMISKNMHGSWLVWKWVRENWIFLTKRYTLNDRYLGRLIPSITQYFSVLEKERELELLFTMYPEAGAGAGGRAKAKATISKNKKWFSKHGKEITEMSIEEEK